MRLIDTKYHVTDDGRIIKTGNGQEVPMDEPMFLFRARDYLAVPALEFYQQLCIDNGCTDYQKQSMEDMIEKFKEFAASSPTMKQPGITEGK